MCVTPPQITTDSATATGARTRSPLPARLAVLPGLLFVLVPIALVYAALWHAERPVPMSDDFLAILNFSLQWSALPHGLPRLLEVIASQHNEYKLVVEHALVASDLALTGQLHFGFLIWTGNLMLLAVGYLFWKNFFPKVDLARRLWLFAPAAWLLFQLNYVENFDWAMCGLQTLPVLLFTLAGLNFLLSPHRRYVALACVCGLLGCLSSGNGFLMAPIGLVVLLQARRLRAAVAWTCSYLLAAGLYLYRYHRFLHPDYENDISLAHKGEFFLSFLGGAAENMHHLPFHHASTGLGVLIFIAFGFACRQRFDRENPFLFWTAAWCLLTAAVVTQARIGEGMALALTLRYKVYSDLLLIFCYGLGASRVHASRLSATKKRGIYAAFASVTVVLVSISDVIGYRFLSTRERNTQASLFAFTRNIETSPEIGANGLPVSDARSALDRRILLRCIAQGIYTLPPTPDL